MAVEITTLELDARLKNAEATIAGLNNIKTAGTGAEMSFGQLAMRIAGLNTGFGLAVQAGHATVGMIKDLAVESVTLSAGFERSRITWGVLMQDMSKGADIFEDIRQFSAETPLTFRGAEQAGQSLKGMGVEGDNLIETLRDLGDLAQGSDAKLQSVGRAYGQVLAKGKADTRDLWQFVDAGVPIVDLLGKSLGKTGGEILKMTADGELSFSALDAAVKKATDEGGQFYDMMAKVAETTEGRASTALDNFKADLANLGESVLPMVTAALKAYNDEHDRMSAKSVYESARTGAKQSSDEIRVALGTYQEDYKKFTTGKFFAPTTAVPEAVAIRSAMSLLEVKLQEAEDREEKAYARANVAKKAAEEAAAAAAEGLSAFAPGEYQFRGLNAGMSRDIRGVSPVSDQISSDFTPTNGLPYGLKTDFSGGLTGSTMTATGGVTNPIYDPESLKNLEKMDDAMQSFYHGMQSIAGSSITSTFESIGESLAAGASGGQTFAEAMSNIGQQATSQFGSLMTTLGLELLVSSNGLNPAGWAFLAAGGMISIGAGAWGYSTSSSSSSNSTSADEINAELASYYLAAEAFNQKSRNSAALTGYANGTDNADGKWHWVGEYEPELMRVPRGAQIIPGHMVGKGYADGLNIPASVVVNVNTPKGYTAETEESTDSNGLRTVEVYVKKLVKSEMAKQTATGRRVTT
jgi:tape measure domain-containing protein